MRRFFLIDNFLEIKFVSRVDGNSDLSFTLIILFFGVRYWTISKMDENSSHKIYQFDCFRLEAEVRRLWCDDRNIRLPAKTFDVLLYLVERHGTVVEREEL